VPYKYPGMESPVWVDVYNRMYRERIMFLSQVVDDNFANTIIAVLLYLESENAADPCSMYFNTPGGVTKSGLAIYDTMRIMPYPIQTVNIGMCAQMGAFLVGGGSPGKRFALPNSRFVMMNPRIDPRYDDEGRLMTRPMQATEMKLEVEEVLRDKKRMLEGFSKFTGRSVDQLRADFGRDFYLSADEALKYGLIDQILGSKRPDKLIKSDIKFGSFGGEEQKFGDKDWAPADDLTVDDPAAA
jgi:ATP-dependent Clp protease protease subunit